MLFVCVKTMQIKYQTIQWNKVEGYFLDLIKFLIYFDNSK